MSLLHLSTKSLPGFLEERDVLDGAGDGVIVLKISQGSFTEGFIKIQHQEGGDFKSRNAFDGGRDWVRVLKISL